MSAAAADPISADQAGKRALRALWRPVFFPNFILATGQGAMLPVLAVAASHVGASTSTASIVVASNGVGTMLFDLPAGRIVARLGEVRAQRACASLIGLGLIVAFFATDPVVLGVGVFVTACGWAIWSLVRLTHISRSTSMALRGRALSIFGGVTRAGNVVGPFFLIAENHSSGARIAFLIYLAAAAIGFGWIAIFRDRGDTAAVASRLDHVRPVAILRASKREFATAGIGVFGISMLRASRLAIVPLWGLHIGLSLGQITLIYALSSIVDLAMFYPAGVISDRFGRKAIAIPCITILSFGHALLPVSHAFSSLFLVALILGFGNGLGSGIVMTLGADRAPEAGRASVLAVWRLVGDVGTSAGPLLDAGIIAALSLAAAGPIIAVIGGGTAFVVGRWMSDPSRHAVELHISEAG